jgi:hypothetical protein
MANLWGYENLPRPPRPRSFGEDAAQIMGPLLQTVGSTVGGVMQARTARELALEKMRREDARFSAQEAGRNARAEAMRSIQQGNLDVSRGREERTAREKAGEINAMPITGELDSVKNLLDRPEMREMATLYRDAQSQAQAGGTVRDANIPQYLARDMTPAEWSRMRAPDLARASQSALSAEQREKVSQAVASRPPPQDNWGPKIDAKIKDIDRQLGEVGFSRNAMDQIYRGIFPEEVKGLDAQTQLRVSDLIAQRQHWVRQAPLFGNPLNYNVQTSRIPGLAGGIEQEASALARSGMNAVQREMALRQKFGDAAFEAWDRGG